MIKKLKSMFGRKKEEKPKTLAGVANKYADNYMRLLAMEKVTKTGLMVGALVVGLLTYTGNELNAGKTNDYISVLELKGDITSENKGTGYIFAGAFRDAVEDKHSKAILIHANSPGGSPVQAEMVYKMIKSYTDKPENERQQVIVSVMDSCASACLYSIAAADKIYAHGNSLLGSIGVRMDSWNFKELSDRLGISRTTITSGTNKALMDPFMEMSDEQREQLVDKIVSPLYRNFVNAMKSARGDKLKEDDPLLFSGMMWTGQEAIDIGLADGIKTSLEVEAELYEELGVDEKKYANEKGFSLVSLLSASMESAVKTAVSEITIQ